MVQTSCQMCLDRAPEITHTHKDVGFSRTQPNIPLAPRLITVPASTKYYKASVSVLWGQRHIVSSRSMRPSALARVLFRDRAGTQEHDSKETRFPCLSVFLWHCGNPLVCESPTGSFPSLCSPFTKLAAPAREEPTGQVARWLLHHVASKRQMKENKVNDIPVAICSGRGDSHCDPHDVQTPVLVRTPFTPFRSPFSRLSRGKEMMLFIF